MQIDEGETVGKYVIHVQLVVLSNLYLWSYLVKDGVDYC